MGKESMFTISLDGRRALVTGGTRGIGEAITAALGRARATVLTTARSFSRPGGVLGLTDEDWLQALSTNLLSAVRIDRLLLPAMLEQRSGVILHTSSVQWRRPDRSSPAYAAAKAALTNYSKEVAAEVAPHGIRVNTIVPGLSRSAAPRPASSGWPAKAARTLAPRVAP